MEGEIWKTIHLEDFKNFYQVSNYGNVKSTKRKLIKFLINMIDVGTMQ